MISARRWKNRKMIAVKNPFYFFSCRYKDSPTEMMTISKLFRNRFLFLNKFYSIYIFFRIYRYLFLTKRWKSVLHVNFMELYYNTGWYLSLSGKLTMTMVFMFHVGRKGRKKHSTERGYFERCFHVSPQKTRLLLLQSRYQLLQRQTASYTSHCDRK